jgi:hypothetical protein
MTKAKQFKTKQLSIRQNSRVEEKGIQHSYARTK